MLFPASVFFSPRKRNEREKKKKYPWLSVPADISKWRRAALCRYWSLTRVDLRVEANQSETNWNKAKQNGTGALLTQLTLWLDFFIGLLNFNRPIRGSCLGVGILKDSSWFFSGSLPFLVVPCRSLPCLALPCPALPYLAMPSHSLAFLWCVLLHASYWFFFRTRRSLSILSRFFGTAWDLTLSLLTLSTWFRDSRQSCQIRIYIINTHIHSHTHSLTHTHIHTHTHTHTHSYTLVYTKSPLRFLRYKKLGIEAKWNRSITVDLIGFINRLHSHQDPSSPLSNGFICEQLELELNWMAMFGHLVDEWI